MAVTFELKPREPKSEQCWIYVNGVLTDKCATADRVELLAAYGRIEQSYTPAQQRRLEQASRGRNNGYGFSR